MNPNRKSQNKDTFPISRELLTTKDSRAPAMVGSDLGFASKEARYSSSDFISFAPQFQVLQLDIEGQKGLEQSSGQRTPSGHRTPSEVSEDPKSKRFKIDRRTISDAILGLSDGLTVPFALSAGLSSLGTTRIVILGGLAELVAGAISMGLGGFLGARSELESYNVTLRNTKTLIENNPSKTAAMVDDIFQAYDLPSSTITVLIEKLQSSPDALLSFLMSFHHQEALPTLRRAYKTAFTLALSYFLGGLIPLIPYLIVPRNQVMKALWWSVGVMGITLMVFGYTKSCIVVGWSGKTNILAGIKGGLQMLLVGAAAAGAAVGFVRAIEQGGIY